MSLFLKSMPKPMVKIEEDEDVIIDLECTEVPLSKGPLIRWHKHVLVMLKKCYMTMSETPFEDFLKYYKRSLTEQINNLNNKILTKDKILLHLNDIDNLYGESRKSFLHIPNYFEYLEDILSEYVNLELEIVKHLRKRDMAYHDYVRLTTVTGLKICKLLSTYLKHNEEHIMHTLLKIRYEKKSVACRDVLNIIYLHFVVHLPLENTSDVAFCRNYLVLESWKEILNKSEHGVMDKLFTKKFKKSEDYISRCETLKLIRTSRSRSINSILNEIMDNKMCDKEAYFEYIKKNKEHDDNPTISDSINFMTLDDDVPPQGNSEFSALYNNIMNNYPMKTSTKKSSVFKDLLFEEEDDRCKPNNLFPDDVQCISESNDSYSESNPLPSLVYIIDDDSDIEEIVYLDNKRESTSNRTAPLVCIDLVDENSDVEEECIEDITNNSETNNEVVTSSIQSTTHCDTELLTNSDLESEDVNDKTSTRCNQRDAEIQTDPATNMYDTPPSERQFEENSPHMDIHTNNIYLETASIEMGIDIATNIEHLNNETAKQMKQMHEVSCEADINESESDKENNSNHEIELETEEPEDEITQLNTSIDIGNDSFENELFESDVQGDIESTSIDFNSPNAIDIQSDDINIEFEDPVSEETNNSPLEVVENQCVKVIIEKVETISDASFDLGKGSLGKDFDNEEPFCENLPNECDKEYNNVEYTEVIETEIINEDMESTTSETRHSFPPSPYENLSEHNFSESDNVEESKKSDQIKEAENSDESDSIQSPIKMTSPVNNNFISLEPTAPPAINGVKVITNNNKLVEGTEKTQIQTSNENNDASVNNSDKAKVDVLPVNVNNSKIMYSSSKIVTETDFNKFELTYRGFNDNCVSDVLSGPVTKLNGTSLNHNDNFDLFDIIQAEPINSQWKSNVNNADETLPKNTLSTNDTNSNQAIGTSPHFTDIDISDFKDFMKTLQTSQLNNGASGSLKLNDNLTKPKVPKRVAVRENNNKFYPDDRNPEDIELIYGKKMKIQRTPKYNRESSYIRQIRKKDPKLQVESKICLEKLTENQLWEKYQREIEVAMLKRSRCNLKNHNSSRSCILTKMIFSKKDEIPEKQIDYPTAGPYRSLDIPNLPQASTTHSTVRKKRGRRPGKRKNQSSGSVEEPDELYTTRLNGKKKGRNINSSSNLSNEFDKLLKSPSYVHCSYKSSS